MKVQVFYASLMYRCTGIMIQKFSFSTKSEYKQLKF